MNDTRHNATTRKRPDPISRHATRAALSLRALLAGLTLVLACLGCSPAAHEDAAASAIESESRTPLSHRAAPRWTPASILAPTTEPTQPPVTPPAEPTPREPSALIATGRYLDVALGFDGERALENVRELTDIAFAGRQGGSPENAAAAEYIASRFAEYGLQPAGVDGYMQPVPLPYARLTAMPRLAITRADGTRDADWVYREHWAPLWQGYAGGGVAEGEVHWLGHGEAEAYHGLDVSGEIVLVAGMPDDDTIRRAVEHGADGLLLWVPDERRVTIQRTYRAAPYLPESFPVIGITDEAVERLLVGGAYTRGDLSILYESVPLGARARFEISMDEPGMAWGQNVLGALPGADPALRREVLVLGGHYDHVGLDANGDHYAGANDNASGVAVLIELARLWHEAGYTPDRTVLFAAWDGEEQGLFGAWYYVNHPIYAIADTIGMVQLDMVGLTSDGLMALDGMEAAVMTHDGTMGRQGVENRVAEQMAVSAGLIDVPTVRTHFQGRSDHEPFLRARVPATLLIWDNGNVPYYHTPQDTFDTLEPERLRQTGAMLAHAAMSLASDVPRILDALARQTQAVRASDRDAYLATFDPDDTLLHQSAGRQFDALTADARAAYTTTLRHLHLGDGSASLDLAIGEVDGRSVRQTATLPTTLVRRGDGWFASWPQTRAITGTHLVVQSVASMAALSDGVLDTIQPANRRADDDLRIQRLDRTYERVCERLTVDPPPPTRLTLTPDEASLRWLRVGADAGDAPSPLSGAMVARSAPLTRTALSALLRAWGLPTESGLWLREGLEAWIEVDGDANDASSDTRPAHWRFMRRLDGDVDPLAVLDDNARDDMARGLSEAEVAVAYSLVDRLLVEGGIDAIEAFCRGWASGGEASAYEELGTPRDELVARWRVEMLDPVAAAREGLLAWTTARREAVNAGDEAALLRTLSPDAAALRIGQRYWLADLRADPARDHTVEIELVELTDDGALAELSETVSTLGGESLRSRGVMRYAAGDDGWQLVGPRWAVSRTQQVTLYLPEAFATASSAGPAMAVEHVAESYARVSTALGIARPDPLLVQVYPSADALRAATGVSLPGDTVGWAAPHALSGDRALVRVVLGAVAVGDPVERDALLTEWMARAMLDRLDGAATPSGERLPEWAREGIALHLAARVRGDDLIAGPHAAEMRAAREAARLHRLYAWDAMPDPDDLSVTEAELWRGQSLALVHWLVDDWGDDALAPLARALAAGRPVAEAFSHATGESFSDWQPIYEGRLANGGIPNDLIALAQRYDVDEALATVAALTAPEMAGRRAGSPGAERAADWIETRMREIGLAPGIEHTEYIHQVEVSFGELAATPTLIVRSPDGAASLALAYPGEFREIVGDAAGGGAPEGELAWLPRGFPSETDGDPKAAMDLGGRIAMLAGQRGQVGVAERAIAHGASGVILVIPHYDPEIRELYTAHTRSETVPVVQITEDTLRRVLALADMTAAEAYNGPPVLLTGLRAQVNVPYAARQEAIARTLVGVLPGSDPDARAVVLVAHYDGVGDLPDGTRYPGANMGVSGVATLLEVARLWVESGRQPARSLYVVALGAEEVGEASSAAWARDTLLPPERVEALFVADTVGRARGYWFNVDAGSSRYGAADPEGLVRRMMLGGELLERRVDQDTASGGGTRALLRRRGYPATLLHWPNAPTAHTPDDTVENLDPAKMATAGEVLALTTLMLAN